MTSSVVFHINIHFFLSALRQYQYILFVSTTPFNGGSHYIEFKIATLTLIAVLQLVPLQKFISHVRDMESGWGVDPS